jgi:pilus assembly protein CpaE
VVERHGLHLLLAPERPESAIIDPSPVQEVLEFARSSYDYIVADLGSVCEPVAMATLALSNAIFLVCSSDLPSLFLMRRTIPVVEELGYSRDQVRILVNRLERRAELTVEDMEKIFRAKVHTTFPEDPAGVARALRDGEPLADNSELGRGLSKFVRGLVGDRSGNSPRASGVGALKELLSGIS